MAPQPQLQIIWQPVQAPAPPGDAPPPALPPASGPPGLQDQLEQRLLAVELATANFREVVAGLLERIRTLEDTGGSLRSASNSSQNREWHQVDNNTEDGRVSAGELNDA